MNSFCRFLILIYIIFNAPCLCGWAIEETEQLPQNAMEEIQLDKNIQQNEEEPQKKLEIFGQKDVILDGNHELKEDTLAEKLRKVYKLEITQTDTPVYALKDVLTVYPEKGIIKRAQLFGAYRGDINFNLMNNGTIINYETTAIEAGIDGEFRNGWSYQFKTRLAPNRQFNYMQNLISNMYIANNNFFKHCLLIGNSKLPIGIEGGQSSATLLLVNRSQLARNFGNSRKVGARLIGNWDLIDYDLGIYSSDTFFREFFPGVDFTGWVNLKPLGKTNGKYGKLTIGGGVSAGTHNTNYAVGGAYVGYEYKRLLINWEGAIANGYNGQFGLSSKRASGFYTTVAYKITPKVQLVGRFDTFDADRDKKNSWRQEISAGLNYYIKGQALKLMINYVFCRYGDKSDSHRLFLGTQILL